MRIITPTKLHCFQCGHDSNRLSSVVDEQDKPEDGDVVICVYCLTPGFLDASNPDGVRKPSPTERRELMRDPITLNGIFRMMVAKLRLQRDSGHAILLDPATVISEGVSE